MGEALADEHGLDPYTREQPRPPSGFRRVLALAETLPDVLGLSLGDQLGLALRGELGLSTGEDHGNGLGLEVELDKALSETKQGGQLGLELVDELGLELGYKLPSGSAIGPHRAHLSL